MSSYAVRVAIATSAEDTIVEVPGLGAFKNNTISLVSDNQVANFELFQHVKLEDAKLPAGIDIASSDDFPEIEEAYSADDNDPTDSPVGVKVKAPAEKTENTDPKGDK